MAWDPRIRAAVPAALPCLLPTQAASLVLLVGASSARRPLCLTDLARADPTPAARRVAAPKHDLLHRLERRRRFLGNGRVDPLAVQLAVVPHPLARLGGGGRLDLALDRTVFDAKPSAGSPAASPRRPACAGRGRSTTTPPSRSSPRTSPRSRPSRTAAPSRRRRSSGRRTRTFRTAGRPAGRPPAWRRTS